MNEFRNYPADMRADLKKRVTRDYVVHLVIEKENEEMNGRVWGGQTKKGLSVTKLWKNLLRAGAYGLNWNKKQVDWIGLDIDAKNNGPIKSDEDRVKLAAALAQLGYCEIRNSSSGKGLHVYVDLHSPIENVDSERGYASYRNALADRIETDLKNKGHAYSGIFDRVGTVLYQWKRGANADAYCLIHAATQTFPDTLAPSGKTYVPTQGPGWPVSPDEGIIRGWSSTQYAFFDYLANHDPSFTPSPAPGIICHAHTGAISDAIKAIGLPGYWSTNTPATNPGHHNCYFTTLPNSGVIRVWRAGNGPASETDAWLEVNGRTAAILNGVARSKICILTGLNASNRTERARGPISLDVLKKLGIPFDPSWTEIEANIQVNKSQVKFIVKRKKDTPLAPGWLPGTTTLTYTLDIDDSLHDRKVREVNGLNGEVTNVDDIDVQFTRDDSNEMVIYFRNENGIWQHSTNDTLLRAYLSYRYKLKPSEVKDILARKYANDVMLRVEMPCIPFGKFEYEKRAYWNVPPTDYVFPKMDGPKFRSRLSYIDASLLDLSSRCPSWFALYNHIFGGLQVPQAIRDRYNIETGGDYGLLWSAYKIADPLNIVPILVLTGPAETGKTFFADSFRHFFTGRGSYKVTNAIASNYADWQGVVVGASDDLDKFDNDVITRLKNIGSGDRLEVNPKFKRPSIVAGYMSLVMSMQELGAFPQEYLKDRSTYVKVPPITDIEYKPEFFSAGCRDMRDPRIHARIPNVHWTLNNEAEAFFQYLCSIELPVPVRRYALPPVWE